MSSSVERTIASLGEEGVETLLAAIDDPVLYAQEILGHRTWRTQDAILRALTKPNARVAVKACHASSKTFTAAEALLWWVTAFEDGKVLTTAPVFRQVKKLLWTEVRKACQGSLIGLPEPNQTSLELGADNYALGLSTRDVVAFQGWHGKVLLIIDEAPGVRRGIFDAIEGVRAGGDVRVLMLGNPTERGGPFEAAFEEEGSTWVDFTINAFATPNLIGIVHEAGLDPFKADDETLVAALVDHVLGVGPEQARRVVRGRSVALREAVVAAADLEPVFGPLVSVEWVMEKWLDWGPGSPKWDGRVMGRFSGQSEDSLVPSDWLRPWADDVPDPDEKEPEKLVAGLDPAGPGEDETALCIRRGEYVLSLRAFQEPDARGVVVRELLRWGGPSAFSEVRVDEIGEGRTFVRHLEDLKYPVVGVNWGGAVDGPTKRAREKAKEEFDGLKSQAHWTLREKARAGTVKGLGDKKARSQLAAIRWGVDARGRVTIEKKESLKKRGVGSPDRGESVILAFMEVYKKRVPVARAS